MILPIGGYIPPFLPLSNVTPFTYRDGETNAEMLRRLRDFLNIDLVSFVNDNFTQLGTDFQEEVDRLLTEIDAALALQTENNNVAITELTTYVNESIADIIGSSVIPSDAVVAAILADIASASRVYLNTLYASKATETTVSSGRLTDANLQAEFALKSVETLTSSGRLTVAALDAAYASKATETTVSSGRLTDANLQAEFALKSVETIVTSGRLSVASLDTAYIDPTELAKYSINQFSTAAALIASTPAGGSQTYASALNCPGALFRYDSGAWKMYGEAFFADITARDAALTNTVLTAIGSNARCYLTGSKMRMENSVAAPSVTTWNKVGRIKPTAATVSAGNGSSVINDDGSVTITFTAAGNVIISNCIAATALTPVTDIELLWSSATGQTITMKQASGGVVDPVTTGYDTYGQSFTQAGAAAVATALNQANWLIGNGASSIAFETSAFAIRNALDATRSTRVDESAVSVVTNGTAETKLVLNLNNRASTAFDGLQLAVSGAGTLIFISHARA